MITTRLHTPHLETTLQLTKILILHVLSLRPCSTYAIRAPACFMVLSRDKKMQRGDTVEMADVSSDDMGICSRAQVQHRALPVCALIARWGSFLWAGRRCWLWFSEWIHRKEPSLSENEVVGRESPPCGDFTSQMLLSCQSVVLSLKLFISFLSTFMFFFHTFSYPLPAPFLSGALGNY